MVAIFGGRASNFRKFFRVVVPTDAIDSGSTTAAVSGNDSPSALTTTW